MSSVLLFVYMTAVVQNLQDESNDLRRLSSPDIQNESPPVCPVVPRRARTGSIRTESIAHPRRRVPIHPAPRARTVAGHESVRIRDELPRIRHTPPVFFFPTREHWLDIRYRI